MATGLLVAAVVVGLFWNVVSTSGANKARLQIQEHTLYASCRDGNSVRAAEVKLWEYIITLSAATPHPNETVKEKLQREEQLRQFRVFLAQTFKARDCSQFLS